MSESTFSQRYASADSNTAGAFAFDTISAKDYAVSKLAFGAVGSVTYVSSADPLPVTISGVATSANQDTANGLLTTIDADTGGIATAAASIDTKTPALGQALEAASVPVVLTAAQVTTLTPPAAITGFALESGGNLAAAATDLAAIEVLLTTIEGNQLADGHNVTIDNPSIAVTGTFWQATQPVSAASLPLPSGASTEAKQPALGTAGTASADVITVQGVASMTPLSVSGTVTAELSAVDNAVLDTIAASLAGTLTVGSHDVTNAGTFAVQAAQSGTWTVTGTGGTFPVTDSGGSLTVDAPVGTPVFVRLSDGSSAISTLPVSLASVPSHDVTNAGTFAVQAAQSGTWTVQPGNTANTTAWLVTGTGGTFPVTGTVTAELSAVDNAVLDAIAASLAGTLTVAAHAVTNAGTFPVQVDAALPAGTNNIGDVDIASGTITTVTTLTGSGVAHDGADSGNPHKIGAKAVTSISGLALVANADRTDLFAGVDGVQITRNHTNLEDIVVGNASNTDGTSTEVIAAAGASIKQYLTSVTLTNMSSTGIYVEMKSGTTVRWRFPVPANSGVTHRFDPPLPPNAANEAWNFDPSAAATTIYCSAMGFKSKV